jgi:hypothetical protein
MQFQLTTIRLQAGIKEKTSNNDPIATNNDTVATSNGHYKQKTLQCHVLVTQSYAITCTNGCLPVSFTLDR